MAEQVKRRIGAARVAVAFAAAGVIAGGAASASGAPDRVPPNSVGTAQIENGSLTFKDFKDDQVYSVKKVDQLLHKIEDAAHKYLKIDDAATQYYKQDAANATFLKITDAATSYLKRSEASSFLKVSDAAGFLTDAEAAATYFKQEAANATFLKIADAAASYLKIDDADEKYLKVDAAIDAETVDGIDSSGFVQGDGSVFTGVTGVAEGEPKPLLSIPELVEVSVLLPAKDSPAQLRLTKGIGNPNELHYVTDGKSGQVDGEVPVPVDFDFASDTQVVQLISGDLVATLSVSALPTADGADAFGQILIGSAK